MSDWRYEEQKAAELVALMYSPKLTEPLKTKLGEAALQVIRDVVADIRDEERREREALAAQNIDLNQGCVDYEKALSEIAHDCSGIRRCHHGLHSKAARALNPRTPQEPVSGKERP